MRVTRYRHLASHFEGAIQNGTLRAGDRLPSIRMLRDQFRLSPSTIVQALLWLEDRGYIEARARSGYYVRSRPQGAPPVPTATRALLAPRFGGVSPLVGEVVRAAADPGAIALGATCPPAGMTDRLNRWIVRVARQRPEHSARYEFPPGHADLRRQIARRATAFGTEVSAGEVVITSGAMEALNLAVRAVARPGDVIAVESPTYFGILQILESHGMRVVEIPTDPRHGMDLGRLEFAIRRHHVKACIVMSNCHNPLGYVMADEDKRALLDLARRHRLPIIEDDVYGELAFSDQRPRPIKAFDADGLVLLCSSFSKTIAPGLRIGWIHAGRFHGVVEELQFITTVAAPSLQQAVLAGLLESGRYERHLRQLRRQFRTQVGLMTDAVARHFPEGTRLTQPDGGFLLWAQLPGAIEGRAVYREALAGGISIVPGEVCSSAGRFRNCIRLSAALPWSPVVEQAVATLGRICHGRAGRARPPRAMTATTRPPISAANRPARPDRSVSGRAR